MSNVQHIEPFFFFPETLAEMDKLNFPPFKGLLCFFYFIFLRGHLFHALRLHPEARVTSQAIAGFCPVRSSRHSAPQGLTG